MKRINLSKGRSKMVLRFIALLFLSVQFTSCEKETDVLASGPSPALDGVNLNCKQGEYRWFDLKDSPSINPPDYVVQLETGTFFLDECLCRVVKYRFEIDTQIPSEEITVMDNYSQFISFSAYWDTNGNTVVEVDDPEVLATDEYLTAFINLLQYSHPNYVPTLRSANGLCIIENVGGGPPPPTKMSSPYIETTFDSNGNPITRVFIPASMTY